ncbi:MAG: hypothetical protein KKD48_01430 [Nanoarchaeota archaeon]|nr:hypothetical protein [Nanoarchaeota archaeon]
MKKGRILDNEITENIYSIMLDKGISTNLETIRKEYKKRFMRNISWNTIRHHLDILKEENKIGEEIIMTGRTKRSSIVKVI